MSVAKWLVLGIWVVLAALAVLPGPAQLYAVAGLAFLLVAHVIEFLMFLPLLRQAPGGPRAHLLPILIYGVFHARTLRSPAA